jgi:nitrous oxidase accessory protein NosD
MKKILFSLVFFITSLLSNELQEAIDNASEGSIITLSKGEYHGNIVINKALVIDGIDKKAKIIGDGKGAFYKLGFTGTMPTELADKLSILGSIGTEKKYIPTAEVKRQIKINKRKTVKK